MDWLAQNWVWVIILVAFVGLHLFGHGGHGGHGEDDEPRRPTDKPRRASPGGHQH